MQRTVTRTELKTFFAGRKPEPFAKNVRAAVAQIDVASSITNHFPQFDYGGDYARVKDYAQKLVDYLADRGNTTIHGLPPSQRTKVYDPDIYLKAKDQTQKRHISQNEVSARLGGVSKTAGAEEVSATLILPGERSLSGQVSDLKIDIEVSKSDPVNSAFQHPFLPHNHAVSEIATSQGDGEVKVLSKALGECRSDLDRNRQNRTARTHKLALIGPYGACDGCKDRLRAFKAEWKKLAANSAGRRELIITYFYLNQAARFRDNTTLYGWHEALSEADEKNREFWYRSYNASV